VKDFLVTVAEQSFLQNYRAPYRLLLKAFFRMGFFYSLNAMHKALAKRVAICQSGERGERT